MPLVSRGVFEATVNLKKYGSLLALDVGTKKIGIATTDLGRQIASPLGFIIRKPPINSIDSLQRVASQLGDMVISNSVVGIIIGLPLLDGQPTPISNHVKEFASSIADLLQTNSSIRPQPIIFWDESHSTIDARRIINAASSKRSVLLKRKDSVAASLILQSYLGSRGR